VGGAAVLLSLSGMHLAVGNRVPALRGSPEMLVAASKRGPTVITKGQDAGIVVSVDALFD
jgi:hypothetical protein